MSQAVKKTIYLPPALAKETEEIARKEGKTLSAIVQEALRAFIKAKTRDEFSSLQGYWSRKAKDKDMSALREFEG